VVADRNAEAWLHFTVSPDHREAIEEHLSYSDADLSFSEQDPATDMIALGENDEPFRDDEGHLLFRPGGHGALIRNLDATEGDIVLIKNIDNVAVGKWREVARLSDQHLTGILLQRQEMAHRWWERLQEDADEVTLKEVALFVRSGLHRGIPEHVLESDASTRQDWLLDILERPIRVCGMVRNEGEPGGGPFWVRDAEGGESLHIVESSQINHADPEQEVIFRGVDRPTSIPSSWSAGCADRRTTSWTSSSTWIRTRHSSRRSPTRVAPCGRWSARDSGMGRWRGGTRSS
jgi:hypothetical protein